MQIQQDEPMTHSHMFVKHNTQPHFFPFQCHVAHSWRLQVTECKVTLSELCLERCAYWESWVKTRHIFMCLPSSTKTKHLQRLQLKTAQSTFENKKMFFNIVFLSLGAAWLTEISVQAECLSIWMIQWLTGRCSGVLFRRSEMWIKKLPQNFSEKDL